MKMEATAYRKSDLRTACGRISLKTEHANEAELLAAIYRVLVFGGEIAARPLGSEPCAVEWDGLNTGKGAPR